MPEARGSFRTHTGRPVSAANSSPFAPTRSSEKVVAPNCALGQQALFRRPPREERAHACFDRRSPGMSSLVDGTSATLLQRGGQRQQRQRRTGSPGGRNSPQRSLPPEEGPLWRAVTGNHGKSALLRRLRVTRRFFFFFRNARRRADTALGGHVTLSSDMHHCWKDVQHPEPHNGARVEKEATKWDGATAESIPTNSFRPLQ